MRKRRAESVSGVDQEGERERTTVEVSKVQTASKPGADLVPGMSLGDTCLLPRWCPACRWRELGSGFCSETREPVVPKVSPGGLAGGERERSKR